jgi:hypothetical protein
MSPCNDREDVRLGRCPAASGTLMRVAPGPDDVLIFHGCTSMRLGADAFRPRSTHHHSGGQGIVTVTGAGSPSGAGQNWLDEAVAEPSLSSSFFC